MIVKEKLEGLLNYACKLDMIEGDNSEIFEKHAVPLIKNSGWRLCPFNIDGLIF